MTKKLKVAIMIYGITILIASFLHLFITFYMASHNGLINGKYQVLIDTNVIGENWYEVIGIFVFGFQAVIMTTYYFFKDNLIRLKND